MNRKYILISSLLLGLFLLIGSLCVATKTEWGSQLLLRSFLTRLPEASYEGIHGKLLGKLEIDHLQFQGQSGQVSLQHITAKTKWPFPYTHFVIETLAVEKIQITPHFYALWHSNKTEPFRSPVNIIAPHIELPRITMQLGDQRTIELPELTANLALSSQKSLLNIYDTKSGLPIFGLIQNKKYLSFNLDALIKKTKWKIQFSQKKKAFDLNGVIEDHLGGRIILQGKNTDKNEQQIELLTDRFHPDQLFPMYWPGAVSLNMTLTQNKHQTKLQLQKLTGDIHGQPLSGSGLLIIEGSHIPHIDFNLKSQSSKISLMGKKINDWQLEWLIDVPDLKLFIPQSTGKINAKGSIRGNVKSPSIEGTITINNLHVNDYELQEAKSEVNLDLENEQAHSFLRFNGNNFKDGKFRLDHFSLEGNGSLKEHELKIAAKSQNQSINLNVLGKWKNSLWLGRFNEINLNNLNQHWHLQKPAELAIKKGKIQLSPLLLGNAQSSLFLTGFYEDPAHFNTKVLIHNLDLEQFNFLLGENKRIEGKLNLNAVARGSQISPVISLSGNLLPGAIFYKLNDEQQKSIFTGGTFTAHTTEDHTLSGTGEIRFPEGHISTKLIVPFLKKDKGAQPLQGKITAELKQIHFLELFIPAIKKVTGQINADFALDGTIKQPVLRGNLLLSDGQFQIPKLNLNVTNVNVKARADGKNITYSGDLKSGTGVLHAQGQSRIENDGIPIDLQLQGTRLLVCNKPEINLIASPKMRLNLVHHELKLNGSILIDEGSIHPHDFGSTETASDDIVFVKPSGEETPRNSIKISSSLSLSLGNNVSLNYKGIKGQVLGQLRIEDDPNKATVGYGQLQLEGGTYSVYGKTLQIDYGKLNFTGGPISNPGLDIRASRSLQASRHNTLFTTQEQIRVGVAVLGTLQQPKIDLFSEPGGMPSSDILSYLLLGSPANAISETNSELLLEAASAMNLKSTNKLLSIKDQIKKGLGLSELDIGTQSQIDPKTHETFQHTAFILGKYLSPKFYVNYSLDLFDHTNTLKVRYLLNRFWTVQSVANTNGSGVDILYTVER